MAAIEKANMPREARKPTEALSPGVFIRQELVARGWTPAGLALLIGRPLRFVNEIINGRKRITPDIAKKLGLVFGTGMELWMNVGIAYRSTNRLGGRRGKWTEDELLRGVTPKMIGGEVDWGGPAGKEVW